MSSSRARSAPARAAASASASPSSRSSAARHRVDVARRHDRAGPEPADHLAEPADVVDDRRDAGAEHLQERARDVDLGPVGKERDRRLATAHGRAPRPGRYPSRHSARSPAVRSEAVERHARIADDEEPRAVDAEHRLDGVLGSLVRPDEPEAERGAPVVARARSSERKTGCAITRSFASATPKSTSCPRPRSECTTTRSKRSKSVAPHRRLRRACAAG